MNLKSIRSRAVACILLIFSALSVINAAEGRTQENWPEQPIKLIVPYTAGGVVDGLGRMVAKQLQETFDVSVVVENRTGAGGTIGAAIVADAPADGYTFLVGSTGPISVAKALYPQLSYDPDDDFQPIALLGVTPFLLVVNKNSGWKSIGDLVAASKDDTKKISYGSAGNGSPQHIIGEMFREATGAAITHIPYRGSVQAISDLIGGRIDLMFDNPVNLVGQIQSGTLVALAQTGASRLPILPDVPTTDQAGVNGFEATPWYGLLAPRNVPRAIIERVSESLDSLLSKPEVIDKLASLGMSTKRMSVEEFQSFLHIEGRRWNAAATSAKASNN